MLAINDNSVDDISNFFADDPDAARGGPDLDIVTKFQVVDLSTPNGLEAGVRFVINEGGVDKNIVAACIIRAGIRGLALAICTQNNLDTNYQAFAVAQWNTEMTLRVRRTAEGGESGSQWPPPVPRAFLLRDGLPSRSRTNPTVEFGCPAGPARMIAEFHSFESVRVAQPVAGTLAFTHFRVRDADSSDRLRFRADFALGAGTDGIAPAAEAVRVRLSTPSGGVFYSSPTNDFNPLTGFDAKGTAPRRRWSLSPAERARTGIERFDIEDPNDSGGVSLRDAMTNVPTMDYSTVHVEITIGDDQLTGTVQLGAAAAGARPDGSKRRRTKRRSHVGSSF